SYRSTRFGIVCGDPPTLPPYDSSHGPLTNCHPAPNPPGKEFDVQRYIDRFTLPSARGGLKRDPADVALFAIDAPSSPVEVVLSNPGTPGNSSSQCAPLNEMSNPPCVPELRLICTDANFGGGSAAPAVRLNAVVESATNHARFDVCADDY